MADLLESLRIASVAARRGSFSAAARELGLTPAAVSKVVGQLESRHAVRLFDRSTRHLAPTVEGRRLLARVEGPLREIAEALDAGADPQAAGGVVKVSSGAPFARMAVLPALPAFHAAHPEVQVDLRMENRRVDLLAEGFDCAIGVQLAPDSNLVSRTLATLRPVICAAPAYLAEHGMPRNPVELAAHRLIGIRSESTGQLPEWRFGWRGKPVVLSPSGGWLTLTDPECAAAAAVAGCGIALVGLHHVAPALRDGALVRLLEAAQTPPLQIVVYYAQRRLLPPRTRAFVDHLIATVPQAPALQAAIALR